MRRHVLKTAKSSRKERACQAGVSLRFTRSQPRRCNSSREHSPNTARPEAVQGRRRGERMFQGNETVLGNDAKPPLPQPIDTKKMDTDTETTTAKKYKASEIIAAFENREVECDSPHILLYVTADSCGSLCDLKQHSIGTRIGLKMAMMQLGLANLATQVMQDEPEATAALGGAIARSAEELKKKLLSAALGMMGK